jgi:hypothetical protein
LSRAEPGQAEFFVVANGLLHALLWAAMCVVFGRVKAVANVAQQQDAENRRVWQAIDTLRSASDAVGPATTPNQPLQM